MLTISRELEGNIGRILENVRRDSDVEAMSVSLASAATTTTTTVDGAPSMFEDEYLEPTAKMESTDSQGEFFPLQSASTPHPSLITGLKTKPIESHVKSKYGFGESGVERSSPRDQELLEEMAGKERSNAKYRKMMEFRRKLPSWQKRQEILDVVERNQVVVLSGETGCGKTTQVRTIIISSFVWCAINRMCGGGVL